MDKSKFVHEVESLFKNKSGCYVEVVAVGPTGVHERFVMFENPDSMDENEFIVDFNYGLSEMYCYKTIGDFYDSFKEDATILGVCEKDLEDMRIDEFIARTDAIFTEDASNIIEITYKDPDGKIQTCSLKIDHEAEEDESKFILDFTADWDRYEDSGDAYAYGLEENGLKVISVKKEEKPMKTENKLMPSELIKSLAAAKAELEKAGKTGTPLYQHISGQLLVFEEEEGLPYNWRDLYPDKHSCSCGGSCGCH